MNTVLPCDNDLENSVLGIMILYPEVYPEIRDYMIVDEVFHQGKAQLLWKKLKSMLGQKEFIDIKTVASSLTDEDRAGGLTHIYVVDCTVAAGISSAAPTYSKKLYEKYLMRRVVEETSRIQMLAMNSGEETYDCIINAHTLFSELIELNPTKEKESIDSLLIDAVQDIKNKDSNLIKTGYTAIDKFAGGLTRGEITIIGGRPGHGKTTVMINMLANVLEQGHRAIFFSRELPNSELLKKIICLESQQLSYGMVRKNIFSEQELDFFNSAVEFIKKKYSKDKFLMFDNVKDFSAASSEVKKFKPDIIFDDYIQLISCDSREDQRRLQIEKIVNDYKWLAKDTEAVVVLASQLNRFIERAGTRGKAFMPQLSDLAESGAIEQVAENVFFSYYDYKVQGEKGKGKNTLTICAGKVRYGDSGIVDLAYDGDKCKIHNSIGEMIDDTLPFK